MQVTSNSCLFVQSPEISTQPTTGKSDVFGGSCIFWLSRTTENTSLPQTQVAPPGLSRHWETHEAVSQDTAKTKTAARAGTHGHLEEQRAQFQLQRQECVPPSTCPGCSSLMNCDIIRKQLPHPCESGKSSFYLSLHWFFSSETQQLLHPPRDGQRRKGRPYLTHPISLLPTPHVNIMHPVLIIAAHNNEWNNPLEQWASIMSWPPGVFYWLHSQWLFFFFLPHKRISQS